MANISTSISIRAPEPDKFDGDASKLDTWLYALELYFGSLNWDIYASSHEKRAASFAATLLRGPAV